MSFWRSRKFTILILLKFVNLIGRIVNSIIYSSYREKYNISPSFIFSGSNIKFEGDGEIFLGSSSHISRGSWLLSKKGCKIVIGVRTRIASNVTLVTSNSISPRRGLDWKNNRSIGDIEIGDDCWIGVNVFIKEGVKIGNNCVIGANSVITRNISDYNVVVGSNRFLSKSIDN